MKLMIALFTLISFNACASVPQKKKVFLKPASPKVEFAESVLVGNCKPVKANGAILFVCQMVKGAALPKAEVKK